MRIGALVVGIIGGLMLLFYGAFGYGIGSIADAGRDGAGQSLKLLSVGLPIAALLGAGMIIAQPVIGACLMAVAAVGFIMVLGFNILTLIPVTLLGLGALLGFLGSQGDGEGQRTSP